MDIKLGEYKIVSILSKELIKIDKEIMEQAVRLMQEKIEQDMLQSLYTLPEVGGFYDEENFTHGIQITRCMA